MSNLPVRYDNGFREYKLPSGIWVPSVTSILSMTGDKSGLEKWIERVGEQEAERLKNIAATKGSKLHQLAEDYLLGKTINVNRLMPDMKIRFRELLPYLEKIKPQLIEKQLYSEKFKVAGRCDCIGEYDGSLAVIDFKTSGKVKRDDWITDYYLQGTCYALMHQEMFGIFPEQVIIIIVSDNNLDIQTHVYTKEAIKYVDMLNNRIESYYKEKNYG